VTSISIQSRDADARGAPRESLYVAATLYRDGTPAPVKIRNMSASGALVEGAVLPSVGALVQLIRGELIVHALVAWSAESRCGLKFSGSVDARQWRASPINSEQERVDEIVRLVKAGAVPLPVPPLAQLDLPTDPEPGPQLSGDLRRASELLDELGAALASDPDVVTQHGPKLQNLDIAMQVIAAVETIIAGRSDLNSDGSKLLALRRSADQALQRGV
jgi:hypothetical protein